MRVDEIKYGKTHLFPRLFAVEMGITDFTRHLRDGEAAALLAAEHFDAHGLDTAQLSGLYRWIGPHVAAIDVHAQPIPLVTVLDYQDVVCSFIKDVGYRLGTGELPMVEITVNGLRCVSTAFSLRGILHRHLETERRLKTTARIQKPNHSPA